MKLSAERMNDLTNFLMFELDEKVLYGISYTLLSKVESNRSKIEQYHKIRTSLTADGVDKDAVFREYELSNGWIYELDLSQAIFITETIARDVANKAPAVGQKIASVAPADMNIREIAMRRHNEDIDRLAKKIINAARHGRGNLEIALYSRNRTDNITIQGVDSASKDKVMVKYDAYALRHTDMKEVNEKRLNPAGLMITTIKAYEVLPSCTGVRFGVNISKIGA